MADKTDIQIKIKILEIAKQKLLAGWTQGCFARNRSGESVYPLSNEAYTFCLEGAVSYANHVVINNPKRDYIHSVFNVLTRICGEKTLANFNDNLDRKRSEVVDLIDKAIAEYGEKINKK